MAGQYQTECLPWGKSSLESDSSPPAVAKMSRMNHLPKGFISPSLNRAHLPTPAWRPPHACCSAPGSQHPRYSPVPRTGLGESSSPLLLLAHALALLSQSSWACLWLADKPGPHPDGHVMHGTLQKPSHWPHPGGNQACKGKGPSQTILDAGRAPEQGSPCCGNPLLTLAGIQGTAQLGGVGDH